ncbi:MAG: alpha/beta hydrolase [Oscillospiraceae bacterium]|nr:alpha/beta hydrolase [Oscillospiraceae bacterium]
MIHNSYETPSGVIHYWLNISDTDKPTLVFLPGLTADHRLFDKQVEYFENKYNTFVWDAPGHGASWPFVFDFDLMDKTRWLKEIFEKENITKPVIIGQSMGGYVGQTFAQMYPDKLNGFVAIDSAPLQRKFTSGIEIWLLKKMESVYYYYPWKSLLKTGSKGVATTEYGQKLMYDMMMEYDGDKKRYAQLSAHGMKMLAEAFEKDLPYEIRCPALLICGEKDKAGSAISYNKAWHKDSKIPIEWIKNAGHNSNTDAPETVNTAIENLIEKIK